MLKPMPLLLLVSGLLLAVVALIGPTAAGYPEPAAVSPSWNLGFSYRDPEPIAVRDVTGAVRWYWYITYKVVNDTGSDQLFIPEFTIATDGGQIISAGRNVPASVFPEIKRRLNNPLLDSPIDVVGKLLQGEDYAKESVAIWPAFENDVDQYDVFVAGLSGENDTYVNPITGENVLVRRTLMITYQTPGNHPTPERQPVINAAEAEVMR